MVGGNRAATTSVQRPVVGRPRSDDALVARARVGDQAAYAELVRAHQEIAFRTAMLITRNAAEAEEAAQDGFVKAWSALERFRLGQPFRPWLLAIVANEARNRSRSAARRQQLALRAGEQRAEGSGGPTPADALVAHEQRGALLRALGRLAETDQLVLGCRYLLDMSEAETASTLRIRRGTVKSRSSRALDRLRRELEVTA
jgi:RNA polymerase sigma-70 factor (ECF subfamily)